MPKGIFSLSFVEILIIIFLAFLLLKPSEYTVIFRWFGKMLRNLVASDGWKAVHQASRELQNLPKQVMRESAMDELKSAMDELKEVTPPVYMQMPDKKNIKKEGNPDEE